ncbi:hypothetical protein ACFOY4_06850 [Actinomadura syzygii]|uniref:hypothetical protein n=1 Tax=Actinomadura syzygii TaxID=1427538 RepID=UPI001CA31488|nr:hypothetical protein [Actinomadura syzygii]
MGDDEVGLLRRALLEWGGPAHCSDELAVGMGFDGVDDLLDQCHRIRGALERDEPMSSLDWARALLATEIVFVSDVAGSGYQWATTTGYTDEFTIRLIRSIQRKLAKVVGPFFGKSLSATTVTPPEEKG